MARPKIPTLPFSTSAFEILNLLVLLSVAHITRSDFEAKELFKATQTYELYTGDSAVEEREKKPQEGFKFILVQIQAKNDGNSPALFKSKEILLKLDGKKVKLQEFLPGTWVTVAAWIVAVLGFSVYLKISNVGRLYGALSAIIVFLLWLYIMMICFIIGVIFNSERILKKRMQVKRKRERANKRMQEQA